MTEERSPRHQLKVWVSARPCDTQRGWGLPQHPDGFPRHFLKVRAEQSAGDSGPSFSVGCSTSNRTFSFSFFFFLPTSPH